MLSVDAPGVEELRAQSAVAQVWATWDCCPTLELTEDIGSHRLFSEATFGDAPLEVLLFTNEEGLAVLELVHYVANQTEFPPASALTVRAASNE